MIFRDAQDIDSVVWPVSRLSEAVEILARKSKLLASQVEIPFLSEYIESTDDMAIGQGIECIAARMCLEVESVESSYAEVDQMIRFAAPALIRLPGELSPRFLILLKGGRNKISVIAPNLSIRRIRIDLIRNALTYYLEAPLKESVEQLLAEAGIPDERRMKARGSILREQLSPAQIRGCWVLRMSPAFNFWKQICYAQFVRYLLMISCMYIAGQILMLFNWWIIGKGVFEGHFERAWLLTWALILFTCIPLDLLVKWIGGRLSIALGGLFKQRLLYGAMKLESEEIRHEGAGQFLYRVMESEALDAMVMESGFSAFFSVIQLFMAVWVLAMGTGGLLHSLLLFGWMIIAFLICWRYYLHNRKWSETYREMTNDLVERMVGHRTRLAQEDPSHWHDDEDRYLNHYLNLSESLDKIGTILIAFVSRGWIIVGLTGIAYLFITEPSSKAKLAISLGGILLASQGLNIFVAGILNIVGVTRAWEKAGPLFKAAARSADVQSVAATTALDKDTIENDHPLMICRDLVFRYRDYGKPVIHECNLNIHKGDRLLLEGPSGGGKSTIAALIAGLRIPQSGLVLLKGFDRQTLGADAWRKRVVSAPQFHENHVLTETFAFNLLMGRRWPPLPEDLEEAETICRELGLGDVLDRMPAGFQQMVGESGWQLSHGERSRLYIARALLQRADIIVLDESFAALDPKNLQKALQCVLQRASTLLAIAHP